MAPDELESCLREALGQKTLCSVEASCLRLDRKKKGSNWEDADLFMPATFVSVLRRAQGCPRRE